jgi:predicted 2-oxoglutarate/Fe(II)-dependent dioxygenase YbiX
LESFLEKIWNNRKFLLYFDNMKNKVIEEVLFTKDECNHILSFAINKEYQKSEINDVDKERKVEHRARNSEEIKLNGNLFNFILPKLKKFGIISMPDYVSIIKYETGCFFKKHLDADKVQNRYKSMVVQLSDETDYGDGNMIYYLDDTSINFKKTIGNTVIFNSDVLHEVTPITSGTRYSFVVWFYKENYNLTNNLF